MQGKKGHLCALRSVSLHCQAWACVRIVKKDNRSSRQIQFQKSPNHWFLCDENQQNIAGIAKKDFSRALFDLAMSLNWATKPHVGNSVCCLPADSLIF